MKKVYSIIIGLSCLFLACSCFPDKNSKSNSSSSSSSTSKTGIYIDNPYIETGAKYSLTSGNTTKSFSFDPDGTGFVETIQTIDGQETKETHEYTFTVNNGTTVNFVQTDNNEQGVGFFETKNSKQAFVCLGISFYRT